MSLKPHRVVPPAGIAERIGRIASSGHRPHEATGTAQHIKQLAGEGRPEKGTSGVLNVAQVVRSGGRTPGGWGAENNRSLHRTEPSEATIESSSPNVAPQGLKNGEIVEFTKAEHRPCPAVKRPSWRVKLRSCKRPSG